MSTIVSGKAVTRMTLDDADFYTPEQKQAIIDQYPAHERDARIKGIPVLGSGRIYPVADETITVEAFATPDHWPIIAALDFGWDHPTAAVKAVWDRDSDTVYVVSAYKQAQRTPVEHVATLRNWGSWLPWAWPHDGLQHDKGTGAPLKQRYAEAGLNMLPHPAKWPDGGNSVEAGLMDILERMQDGRFKVFSHLNQWLEEFRSYHREDGKVVKEYDDLMDATRYAVMSLRFAQWHPSKVERDSKIAGFNKINRKSSAVTGY